MDRSRSSLGRCAAAVIAVAMGLSLGCATPAERARRRATELGFERSVEPGRRFEHVVYRNGQTSAEQPLHVYLEGDGAVLRAARYHPPDATPSNPLMLSLMALDPAPALYLGRPGQHGAASDAWFITQGRYADEVVDSLASILEGELAPGGLALLGHSGGGTLAMLLAERLPNVVAVVTLAGNLDTAAWTRHHRDAPLGGSQNPADQPPLRPEIRQIHAVGGADENVPPELVECVIERQPEAQMLLFTRLDHACCWETVWPEILAELDAALRMRSDSPHEP